MCLDMTTNAPVETSLSSSNKIVNGLWIGSRLTLVELLTIHSFLYHGHDFYLWVYDEILTPLPEGVTVMDATTIIPAEDVFSYKHRNQFGHGKGSVSGFSDIFRYKLLYDRGGWWVDMDVVCLEPLDFEDNYVFRKHHELPMVGNIMKCPKESELMKRCYDQASKEVTADNTDWHKPINILIDNIFDLMLDDNIRADFSNTDDWEEIKQLLRTNDPLPEYFKAVHLCNETWRQKGLEKNDFKIDSTYGHLLHKYGLIDDNFTQFHRLKNRIRHDWFKFY